MRGRIRIGRRSSDERVIRITVHRAPLLGVLFVSVVPVLLAICAPGLGEGVEPGYYAAMAQATPVFYLALLVLRRRRTDQVEALTKRWRETQSGNLRAAEELRQTIEQVEALPPTSPQRVRLEQVRGVAHAMLEDIEDPEAEDRLHSIRGSMVSYLAGGTVIALLAEVAALIALATNQTSTFLLALSALGTFVLVVFILADDLQATNWAGRPAAADIKVHSERARATRDS